MVEITVPNFPESVTDGTIVAWRKRPGEAVQRGEILADIETDKIVFEVPAVEDGVLQEIVAAEGATVTAGQIIARMGDGSDKPKTTVPSVGSQKEKKPPQSTERAPAIMPSARKLMAAEAIDPQAITGSGRGGRVVKDDVLQAVAAKAPANQAAPAAKGQTGPSPPLPDVQSSGRSQRRVPMTRLRARIAERLIQAQQMAAILTTFNEVNMQPIMELREHHGARFEQEHGVRLGLMSFFVKAAVESLKRFPEINASIEGTDIVYHGFYDIGIAVSSPRGLVVPILRDADQLHMPQIEARIKEFGDKARTGTLSLEEITGGTFTITNGGVFGSLLSTPILNPPQSAILGMHKFQPRPVAENGAVVIRPMMYLALSYDHRLIDGREAVQFLVNLKELLEDPARILLGV